MQENNRSELERLDKERHDDFMGMLRGFVANQVPYFCWLYVVLVVAICRKWARLATLLYTTISSFTRHL